MSNETPSGAVAIRNPKDMLNYLQRSKSAIQMALPAHLNADRMVRLALTCFSTTPALRQCSPQSILASVVVASQLGLEPGIAGQGYLIPYKGNCTFVPGWQGLVSLLNNTGRATAWTGAVYEGDHWVFELGSNPRCEHIPGQNYGDPALLQWVYACGRVNGSEQPVIEAWPMSRVWKHRDRYNKVGAKHYSYGNEEMYARKVVLLQVLKYMPRSIELNNAITAADAAEMGQTVRVEDHVVVIDAEPADIPQAKPTFETPPARFEPHPAIPTGPPSPLAEAIAQQIIEKAKIQIVEEVEGAHRVEGNIAPIPEPKPQPAPEPPPEPKKPSVRAKAGPVNEPPGPKEMIMGANVPLDDFTDWMKNTSRDPNAKAWLTYDDVPEQVWNALKKNDMIGVGKCIVLYGVPDPQQ